MTTMSKTGLHIRRRLFGKLAFPLLVGLWTLLLVAAWGVTVWTEYNPLGVIWILGLGGILIFGNALQRREAERRGWAKKMARSEKYNRSLIGNVSEDLLVIGPDYRITDVNRSHLRTLGKKREQVVGRPCYEISHGYDSPCIEHGEDCKFVGVFASGQSAYCQHEHFREGGSSVWVDIHLSPLVDSQGTVTHVIETVRDITERKQAEDALISEMRLSEDYINSLPGLFYCFDQQGFVRWNNEWNRVTGYSDQELAGKYGPDFFEGPDKAHIEGAMMKVFCEGFAEVEADLVTKDGRRIPYLFTGALKELEGKDHLVGFGIDITVRKRAQEAMELKARELSRSNRELGKFAYVVSHDLQEPLRTVSGFVGLLQEDLGDRLDEKSKTYMDFVTDATRRMKALILDLLAYSRVKYEPREVQRVELDQIVRDVTKDLESSIIESGATIDVKGLSAVQAIPLQMRQLMQNLIANALKYHGRNPPKIRLAARKKKRFLEVSVADNGIGMDMKHKDRIFEVFQRLHPIGTYSGTGVGLAICRKIVQNHGGKIRVESVPGEGSTFYFSLPAAKKKG